eukprot:3110581-Amphidinium_carterae.2
MRQKYLQHWENQRWKLDSYVIQKLTDSYGGAADWVTALGPGENVVQLYSCAACKTAPLRTNGWLKAKTCSAGSYVKTQWHCPHCGNKWKWAASAQDRWIIIYSSNTDTNPVHFTWGYNQEDWCEHVFQWLKEVELSRELESVRNEININNVIRALDEMNGRVSERLQHQTKNMETFITSCKDPSVDANYPSCGVVCPDRHLSVQWIGQHVRMAVKPDHSRPIEPEEFIQLCIVLLAMIDPDSYVEVEPLDRKVANKARLYRSQHYSTIKKIIDEDVDKQRKRRSSWSW